MGFSWMGLWAAADKTITVSADVLTIAASVIAIVIFVRKRHELQALLTTVTSIVNQTSLAEIRQKLEEISKLRSPEDSKEIVAIFHDVCGQINGNPLLREKLTQIVGSISTAITGKRISEPQKRALVSQLRESLKHVDSESFAQSMQDEK